MLEDPNYLICVECGQQVNSLFKVYSDGFKDIVECPHCKEQVDSYVECEYSVILIDLILFKKRAYRHIIVNHKLKSTFLFKFLLIFLLCDAYLLWFHVKNRQYESIFSNNQQLFYELEWNFYYMLLQSLLGFFINISVVLTLCALDASREATNEQKYKLSVQSWIYMIIKSFVLSSFGKLVVVPLVIWNPHDIYFNLAFLFTYLSNSNALAVARQIEPFRAAVIVSVAASASHLFIIFMQEISDSLLARVF